MSHLSGDLARHHGSSSRPAPSWENPLARIFTVSRERNRQGAAPALRGAAAGDDPEPRRARAASRRSTTCAASTRPIACWKPASWYSHPCPRRQLLARSTHILRRARRRRPRRSCEFGQAVRSIPTFHLVRPLGNADLSRFLRDLLSRSSVMVSVYEPAKRIHLRRR